MMRSVSRSLGRQTVDRRAERMFRPPVGAWPLGWSLQSPFSRTIHLLAQEATMMRSVSRSLARQRVDVFDEVDSNQSLQPGSR